MSTEYRIRFENNEVIITSRHMALPDAQTTEAQPTIQTRGLVNDPGVCLPSGFPGTQGVQGTRGSSSSSSRAPAGGGEVSQAGTGGGVPGGQNTLCSSGGIVLVFGSVNYYCCGSEAGPGAGELSPTDVDGVD